MLTVYTATQTHPDFKLRPSQIYTQPIHFVLTINSAKIPQHATSVQALRNCSELLQGLMKRLKSRQFVCLWGVFLPPLGFSAFKSGGAAQSPGTPSDYCSCACIHLFIIPLGAKWRLGLWINLGGFNVCFLNPLAPLSPHAHTRAHVHGLFREPPPPTKRGVSQAPMCAL